MGFADDRVWEGEGGGREWGSRMTAYGKARYELLYNLHGKNIRSQPQVDTRSTASGVICSISFASVMSVDELNS